MPDNMFICSGCGDTFVKTWSDEESMAEARLTFTSEELEEHVLICEPCWLVLRAVDPVLDHRYEESFNATT
jgi:hypothetical protein